MNSGAIGSMEGPNDGIQKLLFFVLNISDGPILLDDCIFKIAQCVNKITFHLRTELPVGTEIFILRCFLADAGEAEILCEFEHSDETVLLVRVYFF
jgi:hypothetical protein